MEGLLDRLYNREYNAKCLAITGGVVAAYYILPPDRLSIGAGIAIFTYVGIAWYDNMYGCEDKLISYDSFFTTITKPFKPGIGPDRRYM